MTSQAYLIQCYQYTYDEMLKMVPLVAQVVAEIEAEQNNNFDPFMFFLISSFMNSDDED